MFKLPIGLNEKALPDALSWEERLTTVDSLVNKAWFDGCPEKK